LSQPAQRVAGALQRVLQRYGRLLDIGPRELHAALQGVTPAAAGDAAGAGARAGAGAGDRPPAARA
jgi:hypothetical protein